MSAETTETERTTQLSPIPASPTSPAEPSVSPSQIEQPIPQPQEDSTPPVPEEENKLKELGLFKVYNPPSLDEARPSRLAQPIPNELLEPTSQDLKLAQASLSAKAQALRDAPLLTRQLRERQHEEALKRWPTATLRIRFANRTVIEKVFPSTARIRQVYAFVRECLREDVRQHKFILYTTPPRTEYRPGDPKVKDKTLYDLQLAPASIIMFRFLDESLRLDTTSGSPPLLPEILACAEDLPIPKPEIDDGKPTSSNSPSARSTAGQTLGGSSGVKVPKWLKVGKKK